MSPLAPLLQPLAFSAGTVIGGWQHWMRATAQTDPTDTLVGPGLAVLGVIAALLVVGGAASAGRAFLLMSACLPAAVMALVAVDTWEDPTSHNLWPLELVFAFVVGVVPVLGGVLAGLLLRRLAGPGAG
jgi:hypothetical protein